MKPLMLRNLKYKHPLLIKKKPAGNKRKVQQCCQPICKLGYKTLNFI